jgi:uncharacterized protein
MPAPLAPVAAMAVCVLVGVGAVLTDALGRDEFGPAGPTRHLVSALLLYSAAATVAGVLASLGAAWLAALERRGHARLGRATLAVAAGAIAGAVVAPTAFFTFATERLEGTAVAIWAPRIVIAGTGVGAAIGLLLVLWGIEAALRGRERVALVLSAGFALIAVVAVRLDLTVYVSLYARLHAALEAVAAVSAAAALGPLLAVLASRDRRRTLLGVLVVAGVGVLAGLGVLLSTGVRAWASTGLRHTWREPVLVGRMLARAQFIESYLRNPDAWTDETLSGVALLRQRFDLATTARAPSWDEPMNEPDWLVRELKRIRGVRDKPYSFIIYYVDTLRADVAFDPHTMPALTRFARESLWYRRAYTTGSDTLHALPGLTGGSFDLFEPQENDLLTVAKRAGYRRTLVAARSAREFLAKLLPRFAFDETIEVDDYVQGNNEVWGYGADQPTAGPIVDRTLDWIRHHPFEPFLTWMFNFDVHAWRELDEAYIKDVARLHGVRDEPGALAWRYRVAARAVDAEFERLLAGLGELGRTDDVIILFVSDHGEALGRDGFWVHSVFLWESLVRVPLVLRVPGLPPRAINEPVSLVDVAPTLTRFMVPDAETRGYHGEDLLSYLYPNRPKRRLPLILAGTSKEKLVRLGIIDPDDPYKLVLPLEAAVPELYDLSMPDPDGEDRSHENPRQALRLLNELVRAPLFPRGAEQEPPGEGMKAALRE